MHNESTENDTANALQRDVFPVVAIGASAGGLGAITRFFSSVPVDSHMAFVVITHLNREHKSLMPELIQAHSTMRVMVIEQGCPLELNTVYVIPPNKNILIKNNAFLLVEQNKSHYKNAPIDCFFHSVALAYEKNAVAVVLSGCGSDGALGLRDIKHNGGLVVAQTDLAPKNRTHC